MAKKKDNLIFLAVILVIALVVALAYGPISRWVKEKTEAGNSQMQPYPTEGVFTCKELEAKLDFSGNTPVLIWKNSSIPFAIKDDIRFEATDPDQSFSAGYYYNAYSSQIMLVFTAFPGEYEAGTRYYFVVEEAK